MFALLNVVTYAQTIEETMHVPVIVHKTDGSQFTQQLILTVVRSEFSKSSPFILLLHGRPESPVRFAVMGQVRYPVNAEYFVSKGFVVLIPTRVGYGLTGGPDVEYTGECDAKDSQRGMIPIVDETQQILTYFKNMPYVDTSRGLVFGESFGGVGAIALGSSGLQAIKGAINISGGDGGSLDHLEQPCQPDRLKATFASYGKSNQIATLWMYSLNDRFWGVDHPRAWFSAFVKAGGNGEFASLPADKNNGHYIFTRNTEAWHPAFEAFIHKLNF